jgi:hypothetical protein
LTDEKQKANSKGKWQKANGKNEKTPGFDFSPSILDFRPLTFAL